MADIIKKNMTEIWASAGDVQAPEDSKIRAGWVVESVPRQWWNWFENRQDNNIAYMLQKGIPEWDAETEYQTNKSYVQRNNVVYKATAVSINKDPALAANASSWVKAFVESSAYLEKIKNVTVSPATMLIINSLGNPDTVPYGTTGLSVLATTSPTAARNAIAAQVGHSNLTALSGVTAGTNVLPYFDGNSTMAGTPLTAFGREFIANGDALGGRNRLGLGTASTYHAQANAWSTSGLMLPGAFGLGGYSLIASASANNVNDPNCPTGFYDVSPDSLAGFIAPIPGTWTRIIHQNHANAAGFATQIATGNFANPGIARIFVRKAAGTGWGDWVELMNSSVFPTQAGQVDNVAANPGAGKLMRVGAFGIGSKLDLRDTVWSTGLPFQMQGNGTIKGLGSGGQLGVPGLGVNDLGVLTVDAHWTDNSGIRGYVRTFTNGDFMYIQPSGGTIDAPWAPWRQIYTTANTAQLTNTVTANVTANIQPTLNAIRLANPRTISLYGGAQGSVSFDGNTDAAIGVTIAYDSHGHSISTITGLQAALDVRTPNSQLAYFTAAQSALESPNPSGQVVFSVTQAQAAGGFSPGCSFVRPGYFGVNLGLSNIDNNLRIGGYSMGAISYPILHTGNAAALGFGGTSGALGASGWTRLGNGLIIQWGSFTGNGNIPFPTAFPSACTAVAQMQSGPLSGNVQRIALNGNPGNTSFNVTGVDPSFNLPARWIALGY